MAEEGQAMRDELDAVLRKVRGRITRARERGTSLGEENTKITMIDPILSALGWDVHEFDEVRREYRRKPADNPVDYALLVMREPKLFIEAKDLAKDLGGRKWISQILGYATVVGVEWCVLTNGDEYRLYNSHAAVDVEQKLFRSFKLSEPADRELARDTLMLLSREHLGEQLEDLWRAHFVDRQVKAALNAVFENQDPSLVRLVRKATPGLKPSHIKESLKRADVRVSFPALPTVAAKPAAKRKRAPAKKTRTRSGVQVADLILAGLLEAPCTLEKTYKGTQLTATVDETGGVVFDGKRYRTLSGAGAAARKSVTGKKLATDGWRFWRVRVGKGEPRVIDVLRQELLRRRAASG